MIANLLDPNPTAPPCNRQIGQGFWFSVDETLGYSFSETTAIKCYNGCVRPYLTYVAGQTHEWQFSTYSAQSGTYVQNVLNQIVP